MRYAKTLLGALVVVLLLVACGAPSAAPVSEAQSTATPLPTGQGSNLVGTVVAVQVGELQAATVQSASLELTAQVQATQQAFAQVQTQSGATAAVAGITQEAAHTATAAVNTQEALGATMTLQAVMVASTVQAEEDKAELGALENDLALASIRSQAEQRANGQQMINSLISLATVVLIIVGLGAIVAFTIFWLTRYQKRSNILNVQNLVMQHNGQEWLTVTPPIQQLPAPVRANPDYVEFEPPGDIIDPADYIRVNEGDETRYIHRITDDDVAMRERVLALLFAAMQINGGGSNVIPGWRVLRQNRCEPGSADGWSQAIQPLRTEGYVQSIRGRGSFLVTEEYPDLRTLHHEVLTWRIRLVPADVVVVEGEFSQKLDN